VDVLGGVLAIGRVHGLTYIFRWDSMSTKAEAVLFYTQEHIDNARFQHAAAAVVYTVGNDVCTRLVAGNREVFRAQGDVRADRMTTSRSAAVVLGAYYSDLWLDRVDERPGLARLLGEVARTSVQGGGMPSLSADGTRLITAAWRVVRVHAVEGHEVTQLAIHHVQHRVIAALPGPDGRIAMLLFNGELWLLDGDGGKLSVQVTTPRADSLCWSADGTMVGVRRGRQVTVVSV